MPAERKINGIAPEADQLEQAMRAAGLDPDGTLSYPIWNKFVDKGLRVALAAIEERNAGMETKINGKPLMGALQERSATRGPAELSAADREYMRSGGRVEFTKNSDGTTTKAYVRGPRSVASSSRPARAQPAAGKPGKAELAAIRDRWLSPEAQVVTDLQEFTASVDRALEIVERRRRGR